MSIEVDASSPRGSVHPGMATNQHTWARTNFWRSQTVHRFHGIRFPKYDGEGFCLDSPRLQTKRPFEIARPQRNKRSVSDLCNAAGIFISQESTGHFKHVTESRCNAHKTGNSQGLLLKISTLKSLQLPRCRLKVHFFSFRCSFSLQYIFLFLTFVLHFFLFLFLFFSSFFLLSDLLFLIILLFILLFDVIVEALFKKESSCEAFFFFSFTCFLHFFFFPNIFIKFSSPLSFFVELNPPESVKNK